MSPALAQIRTAEAWWNENRPAAPDAISAELADTFELFTSQPRIGAIERFGRVPGIRRVRLRRVNYHLYYRVIDDIIEVVAFWHASRGSGPNL